MQSGTMSGYVVRRLVQLVPIVFIIAVVNFFLIRLAPGDPIVFCATGGGLAMACGVWRWSG